MKRWNLFPRRAIQTKVHAHPVDIGLELPGWQIVERREDWTCWRDSCGDALSLRRNFDFGLQEPFDTNEVRSHCRSAAEIARSGLIEADGVDSTDGPAVMFVYKRLDGMAFVFTGMLVLAPASTTSSVWTIVARERVVTGVREAAVTAMLFSQRKLTLEGYQNSWAQDPYDPRYSGVDRKNLRFLSDDECYDPTFPRHPLSKVRRELRCLLAVPLAQLTLCK